MQKQIIYLKKSICCTSFINDDLMRINEKLVIEKKIK